MTAIKCHFCDKTVPNLETAIAQGWLPDFWEGEKYIDDRVCCACIAQHLVFIRSGEWVLQDVPVDYYRELGGEG